MSYRDVEELLAERGLDVSYETVRRWVLKFGPAFAQCLRHCRPKPSGCWHLDEMVARIANETVCLWRAVNHEGEVLDILVQRGRGKATVLKLMRKLLKKQDFASTVMVTNKLRSYAAAFAELGLAADHELGPKEYAMTDRDGYELSDRWIEAQMLRTMISASWARIEAEDLLSI